MADTRSTGSVSRGRTASEGGAVEATSSVDADSAGGSGGGGAMGSVGATFASGIFVAVSKDGALVAGVAGVTGVALEEPHQNDLLLGCGQRRSCRANRVGR